MIAAPTTLHFYITDHHLSSINNKNLHKYLVESDKIDFALKDMKQTYIHVTYLPVIQTEQSQY